MGPCLDVLAPPWTPTLAGCPPSVGCLRMSLSPAMTDFAGIPVCGGSRVGPALLYDEAPDVVPLNDEPPQDVEAEVARLGRGLEAAREDLERLLGSLGGEAGIGGIFRAHVLMLDG